MQKTGRLVYLLDVCTLLVMLGPTMYCFHICFDLIGCKYKLLFSFIRGELSDNAHHQNIMCNFYAFSCNEYAHCIFLIFPNT